MISSWLQYSKESTGPGPGGSLGPGPGNWTMRIFIDRESKEMNDK